MTGGGGILPSVIAAKNSAPLRPAPAAAIAAGSAQENVRCRRCVPGCPISGAVVMATTLEHLSFGKQPSMRTMPS